MTSGVLPLVPPVKAADGDTSKGDIGTTHPDLTCSGTLVDDGEAVFGRAIGREVHREGACVEVSAVEIADGRRGIDDRRHSVFGVVEGSSGQRDHRDVINGADVDGFGHCTAGAAITICEDKTDGAGKC